MHTIEVTQFVDASELSPEYVEKPYFCRLAYYAPTAALGVVGICAKPTPEIIRLQADGFAKR
jgi:hypothetical protein